MAGIVAYWMGDCSCKCLNQKRDCAAVLQNKDKVHKSATQEKLNSRVVAWSKKIILIHLQRRQPVCLTIV